MHQRPTRLVALFAALIMTATGAGLATTMWPSATSAQESDAGNRAPVAQNGSLDHAEALSHAFRRAAEVATPTVVTIVTESRPRTLTRGRDLEQGENPFRGTPFEDFFEDRMEPYTPRQVPRQQGVGSGVIIDPSGIILTNNHVVSGADEVTVRLADGREFVGTDIKTDETTDMAVLRLKDVKGKLPAATLGNSDALEIGDWVLAIGSPFRYDSTVSAGIISGKERSLPSIRRTQFLQTDAAINPGNSGGALVNLRGEVVGINTAIASSSGSFAGIGFAVPINLAKWVSTQLIESGRVQRAWLGVGIRDLTATLAREFGVQPGEGALVTEVRPNSPAAKAGFEPGDVVTSFGGKEVGSAADLMQTVERTAINSRKTATVLRNGKELELAVRVEALPGDVYSDESEVMPEDEEPRPSNHYFNDRFGFEVGPITADVAESRGLDRDAGVLVTEVDLDGRAADAGLTEGMVVLRVGNKRVRSVGEFREALERAADEPSVRLLVRTRFGNDFVVLRNR